MIHGKIDFNLFQILRTVYQHGNLTSAAQQLHLTQPAISHALARLRAKFGDELFVRKGRQMLPTERCQAMMPQVLLALAQLEATLTSATEFDIRSQQRQINLGLRDILESVLLPGLVTDLLHNSPNIRLKSQQVTLPEMENALQSQTLDIVVDVLRPTSEQIANRFICHEGFVLMCRQQHPILANLSPDEFARAGHVLVSLRDSRVDHIDMALAALGLSRRIVLQCEHYLAAAKVVCQSDLLLTMPGQYAKSLHGNLPLHIVDLPFAVAPLPVHMYWHKQRDNDLVNRWMRDKISALAADLSL